MSDSRYPIGEDPIQPDGNGPQKKPWFRPRRYGGGIGVPQTWQGWLIIIVIVAVIVAVALLITAWSRGML